MTVQTINNVIVHVAVPGQDTFPYDFMTLSENHIFVFLNGEIYPGGFTVTGVGNPSGGTVVLDDPIPPAYDGMDLAISRLVPPTQEIDYQKYDAFPAETHESGLDKLTMLVQQATNQFLGAIRIPQTENSQRINTVLPKVVDRVGKYITFNEQGSVIMTDSTEADEVLHYVTIDGPSSGMLTATKYESEKAVVISVNGPNENGTLMRLTQPNENRPGSPGGGLPLDVLLSTPELVFAVPVDDGAIQTGVDSTDMLLTFRQSGGQEGFLEYIAVRRPNEANRLLQLDEQGFIPDDLINVSGLRLLGPYRGDDLCDKPGDNPGDCTEPDTRNPDERFPSMVGTFETGSAFVITMAPGETEGTMNLMSEVGSPGMEIKTVKARDGIIWTEEYEDPNNPGTILVYEGWYHYPNMIETGDAQYISYDDTGNSVIFGTNLQQTTDNTDEYLNLLEAEQVRYTSGPGNIIGGATNDVDQALIDLDAGAYPRTGGVVTGNIQVISGDSPNVRVQPVSDGGHPQFTLSDANGQTRGWLFYNNTGGATDGEVVLRRSSEISATQTELVLTADGNVHVNGAAPTAPQHLTRKDYVDAGDVYNTVTQLTSADDLNNIVTSGFYAWQGDAPANTPGGTTWAWMIVHAPGFVEPMQFIVTGVTDNMYTRRMGSGVWNAWSRKVIEGELNATNARVTQNESDIADNAAAIDAKKDEQDFLRTGDRLDIYNVRTS